jgi:hypothetical protein
VSHILLPPSTPTMGRQDHTSLPYAPAPFVFGTFTSTATGPTFMAIMTRPSERDRMARNIAWSLFLIKRNIFILGLDKRF